MASVEINTTLPSRVQADSAAKAPTSGNSLPVAESQPAVQPSTLDLAEITAEQAEQQVEGKENTQERRQPLCRASHRRLDH